MAVITDHFVYLHIPKTGGTFFGNMVESVASLVGFKFVKITAGHELLPVPRESLGDRHVLIGYRHPVSWLRSVWCHVRRSGGDPAFVPMPLAADVIRLARQSHRIDTFVEAIAQRGPFVSVIWNAYAAAYAGPNIETYYLNVDALPGGFMRYADTHGLLDRMTPLNIERMSDTICCLNHRGATNVPRIDYRLCARIRAADPEAFEWFWY